MIRILLDKAFDTERHYIHAVGLSTDTKPTTGIITGSKFVAVDTGAGYLFDETAGEWNENQQLTEAVATYLDEHPEAIDQAAIEAIFDERLDAIEAEQGVLKSALSVVDGILFEKTTDLTIWGTTTNKAMNSSGNSVSNASADVKRYKVTAGTYIYIKASKDTDGVWQFQNSGDFSGDNSSKIVGVTHTQAIDGFVKVPVGATHLIVSQLKTNTSNEAKNATCISDDVSLLQSNMDNVQADLSGAYIGGKKYAESDLPNNYAYIANTANIGNTIIQAPSSNPANFKSVEIPIKPYAAIKVTTESNYNNAPCVIWCDKDKKIINFDAPNASVSDKEYVFSEDVAYVYINYYTGSELTFSAGIYSVNENINSVREQIDGIAGEAKLWKGKKVIAIGDSHSADGRRQQWLNRLCELTGMVQNDTLNTQVAIGGDFTSYQEYVCNFVQGCVKLGDIAEETDVDVIILENVHFKWNSPGAVTDKALKIDHVLTDATSYTSRSDITSAWANNFSTIMAQFSSNRAVNSVVKSKYTNVIYSINFSGSTIAAGTATLTIDGEVFATEINAGMTLNEAVARINEWRFEDYTAWKNTQSGSSILIQRTDGGSSAPTVTFDGGTTGLSLTDVTNDSADVYVYHYFASYDVSDWDDSSKWILYSEWAPAYMLVKGAVEALQASFPKAKIIVWAPTSYNISEASYSSDFNIDNFYATETSYLGNLKSQEVMQNVAEYYNLPFIDVNKLCGITPKNITQFNNFNDVHPKGAGYIRFGETIAQFM